MRPVPVEPMPVEPIPVEVIGAEPSAFDALGSAPREPAFGGKTRVAMRRALESAVREARLLGWLFLGLGGVGTLMGLGSTLSGGAGLENQLILASCGLTMVGPGVLYLLAAGALKRRDPRGGTLGLRAAAAHVAGVLIALTCAVLDLVPGGYDVIYVPPVLAVFFAPPLLAFAWHLLAARRAAALLAEPTGFEVGAAAPQKIPLESRKPAD